MAKAGFCEQCQANVWLLEDGGCEHGHPQSAVTNVYEAGVTAEPPAPGPKKRRWWILAVVVGALLLSLLIGVAAVTAMKPLMSQGTAVAAEWQTRIAEDYPGWQIVGFNVQSFSGTGGSETTYSFGLRPPDRDFAVGVVYVSRDGSEATSMDEVFRPAGRFNERADSLLDYIDRHYVTQGRDVASVDSDSSGRVRVEWVKTGRVGPFSSTVGSFDELEYDEASDMWTIAFSPDASK